MAKCPAGKWHHWEFPTWLLRQCLAGNSSKVTPRAKKCVRFHVKCLLQLSDFNHNWNLSTTVCRTPKYNMQQMDR